MLKFLCGRLAQLVRALPLQGRSPGFESLNAHHRRAAPSALIRNYRPFIGFKCLTSHPVPPTRPLCVTSFGPRLAKAGIHRDDPATWKTARPEHLQHVKADPAFRVIGSACTIQAIDEALECQAWRKPRDWGAFFLQFPIGREWDVPATGWHIDGDCTGTLSPPCGVKVRAMLTDVEPRCGGVNILSGSHRLVHANCTRTSGICAPPEIVKRALRGFTNASKTLMVYRSKSSRIRPRRVT